MKITKIKISNYKSFNEVNIKVNEFNVIIGANASGKSNFISIFNFIKDLGENGLDNAISMQGGIEYLRNINIGSSKNLLLEFEIENTEESDDLPYVYLPKSKKDINLRIGNLVYKLEIAFLKEKKGYFIEEEKLIINFALTQLKKVKKEIEELQIIGHGKINLINNNGEFAFNVESSDFELTEDNILPLKFIKREFKEERFKKTDLILNNRYLSPFFYTVFEYFQNIAVYDIDPRLSKRSILITGKTELESDGSNLAIALKYILEDDTKKEKIYSLTKYLLPFIEDITVQPLLDRSLIASLKEIYSKDQYFPAPLVSDGTINVTALIIILFFEKKQVIVIEEPERNIHPFLISKIIEMMKDVSINLKKQIFVTTHNPEVVKYAGIENLLFINRESDGFSRVFHPSEKDDIKTFLENELGIDELFVQNLLK